MQDGLVRVPLGSTENFSLKITHAATFLQHLESRIRVCAAVSYPSEWHSRKDHMVVDVSRSRRFDKRHTLPVVIGRDTYNLGVEMQVFLRKFVNDRVDIVAPGCQGDPV